MMKSVWLQELIVSSMNDRGSVLYSHFSQLKEVAGAGKSMLVLYEPDEAGRVYFLFSGEAAVRTEIPGLRADGELTGRVTRSRTPEYADGLLYCPLCFENVAVFGVLVCETKAAPGDALRLGNALTAFSFMLYSESMGSIVRSYHKAVMSVKDVSVDYPHGKTMLRAVDHVSLELCEKELTVILGASGSGKSSLLNVLGGMLTAAEGTVMWKNTAVTGMTEKERTAYRAETVGFVFQKYNLLGDLTAEENVALAASLVKHPLPVREVLRMVGLEDKRGSYPSQLSGGEQQRVCIARALVKRAELLLCDEPTGALDTENALHVVTILQHIAKEQGIPVVVITHNPALAVLADRCITVSNGTVTEDRIQPFALRAEDLKLR